MFSIEDYTNSRLKRLSGSFLIYKNKEDKYLHLHISSKIYVDLSFWTYVETVKK